MSKGLHEDITEDSLGVEYHQAFKSLPSQGEFGAIHDGSTSSRGALSLLGPETLVLFREI